MTSSVKYVGIDVHKQSISIAIRNAAGKIVIGKSGFLFELDASQAAAAQAAINGGFNLLGLSATASPALGGPETFFLVNTGDTGKPTRTPEPASLVLLGLELAGAPVLRRCKA